MNALAAPGLLRQKRTKVQIPWSPSVEVIGMRSKVRKQAEKDAVRLVKTAVRAEFAVEPVGVAQRLGIQVRETELDQKIMGALFMRPNTDPKIVVNRRHSFLRRRVTCARELGHYIYMSTRANEYKRADFVDDSEEVDGKSNDEFAEEFAANLLMPKEDVEILIDLKVDDLEMALRFFVPREEMRTRLKSLGSPVPQLEPA
jgi:Zn-dependent peptidase ImmA (M78 family)